MAKADACDQNSSEMTPGLQKGKAVQLSVTGQQFLWPQACAGCGETSNLSSDKAYCTFDANQFNLLKPPGFVSFSVEYPICPACRGWQARSRLPFEKLLGKAEGGIYVITLLIALVLLFARGWTFFWNNAWIPIVVMAGLLLLGAGVEYVCEKWTFKRQVEARNSTFRDYPANSKYVHVVDVRILDTQGNDYPFESQHFDKLPSGFDWNHILLHLNFSNSLYAARFRTANAAAVRFVREVDYEPKT